MLKALILDLDGTILDTETPEFAAWQEAYTDHGVALEQELWVQIVGTSESDWDPYDHLETLVGTPVDRAVIGARQRARFDELIAAAEPRDGIVAWLDEARELGLKVGLASSSSAAWVGRFLDTLGLRDRFDVVATRDRVERGKPDPELYLLALGELGVDATEAIAVEDSPHGVTAAKAAGLFCVAVPNPLTEGLALDHADVVLRSLTELSIRQAADAAGISGEPAGGDGVAGGLAGGDGVAGGPAGGDGVAGGPAGGDGIAGAPADGGAVAGRAAEGAAIGGRPSGGVAIEGGSVAGGGDVVIGRPGGGHRPAGPGPG